MDSIQNIYLAGAIERERTRWGLVDWNLSVSEGLPNKIQWQHERWAKLPNPLPLIHSADGQLYRYCGPFVAGGDDHGSAHLVPHAALLPKVIGCFDPPMVAGRLPVTMRRSFAGVDEAEILVAWFTKTSQAGTIAELTRHHGNSTRITMGIQYGEWEAERFVGFASQELADEHWFLQHMATRWGVYPCLQHFLASVGLVEPPKNVQRIGDSS